MSDPTRATSFWFSRLPPLLRNEALESARDTAKQAQAAEAAAAQARAAQQEAEEEVRWP